MDRVPFSVDDAALCPLFTPDLIELMRTLIAPEKQAEMGTAIVVTARLP